MSNSSRDSDSIDSLSRTVNVDSDSETSAVTDTTVACDESTVEGDPERESSVSTVSVSSTSGGGGIDGDGTSSVTMVQKERSRAFDAASEGIVTGRVTDGHVVPMMVEKVGRESSFNVKVTDKVCIGSIPGVESQKKVPVSEDVYTELSTQFKSGATRDDTRVSVTRENHVSSVDELVTARERSDVSLGSVSKSDIMELVTDGIRYVVDDEDVIPVVYVPVYTVLYHGTAFTIAGDAELSEGAAVASLVDGVDAGELQFTVSREDTQLQTTRTTNDYRDVSVRDAMTVVKTYRGPGWSVNGVRWGRAHKESLITGSVVLVSGILSLLMVVGESLPEGIPSVLVLVLLFGGLGLVSGVSKVFDRTLSIDSMAMITPSITSAAITSLSQEALTATDSEMLEACIPDAYGEDGVSFRSIEASVTHEDERVIVEAVIDGRFETWEFKTLPGDILPEPIRGIVQDTPIHDDELVMQVREVEQGEDPPSEVTSESGNWVVTRDTT